MSPDSTVVASAQLITAWSALARAVLWPLVVAVIGGILIYQLRRVFTKAEQLHIEAKGIKLIVAPAAGSRAPADSTANASVTERHATLTADSTQEQLVLPFDYFFINHTAFFRPDKQQEFRKRTGHDIDHYDIRVIVDSYYDDALSRISRVEYLLDEAYPEPLKLRRNVSDKFLLKELANGESVVIARIYLRGEQEPIILQRYLNLWKGEQDDWHERLGLSASAS